MSTNCTSKTAIITGATGAIGGAIARQIASMDYQVIIIARNEIKAQQIVRQIIQSSGNHHVRYELADLSRRSEIKALVSRWDGSLHLLINNAAVTPRKRLETPEGIEMQFATNVLGYYWMTQSFREILETSGPSRVVDVASYWAGGLDIEDLEFKKRRYSNGSAYRQSKQANRMLTAAWAREFHPGKVMINACHPGDVSSTLSNNLGFGGSQSADQGAETPVWLATQTTGGEVTGKYFENCRQSPCHFGNDVQTIEALFETCLAYCQ